MAAHIDIKLGPFMLFSLPLDAEDVDCEGKLFGERVIDYEVLPSVCLNSIPDPNGSWPDYRCDNGQIVCTAEHVNRYWIETNGCYDQWYQGRSNNTRSTTSRKIKKLEKDFGHPIDVRFYRTPDELEAFYGLARTISKTTYHEKYRGSGLPESSEFLQEMSDRARHGTCYGSILFRQGGPISYFYCIMHEKRSEPTYFGFDPEYSSLSIGSIHWFLLIRDAFEKENCDLLDLGLGQFQYKNSLSTNSFPCANVYILQNTYWNWSAVNMYRLMRWISLNSSRAIDSLGYKEILRKKLRGI